MNNHKPLDLDLGELASRRRENMVRKFAGAFLDGAFAFHSIAAAPTAHAAPQQEAQEPVKLTRDTDMAETRNVFIHIDATERIQMQNATDHNEWFRAIGYLSTWNMTFPTVVIHADGETDMVALYRDEDDRIRYVIGAVWHDDRYGFHS